VASWQGFCSRGDNRRFAHEKALENPEVDLVVVGASLLGEDII